MTKFLPYVSCYVLRRITALTRLCSRLNAIYRTLPQLSVTVVSH